MATMKITGSKDEISTIIDLLEDYNCECEAGHELTGILVDFNTLKWEDCNSFDLCNLQESIERYEWDSITIEVTK